MAQHGSSGRVVIDIPTALKRRLHSRLSLDGSTLKDWFIDQAVRYCDPSARDIRPNPAIINEPAAEYAAPPSERPARPDTRAAGKWSVVSMFSGCGGMDLGFQGGFEIFGRRYARLPFNVLWANDSNAAACKTYQRNLGPIHHGDVWDLMQTMPKAADVVIGGFPCQDISINGKRAGVNGSRSGLYRAMIEAVKRIQPKIFIAENVKSLLQRPDWLAKVLTDFNSLGYTLHHQLYQAADFGVPQNRERVFFVGTAPDIPVFRPPSPEADRTGWMTASQALADLEDLAESPQINHIWSRANISPEQGNRRLKPDRPGHTIRAECHGNIQFHYKLGRRISMREAARLQSFPDKFLFMAGLREIERQIGNAVPPVLAWHIARAVAQCLDRTETHPFSHRETIAGTDASRRPSSQPA